MNLTRNPRRFEILIVSGLILGLWFVMYFAFARARNTKRQQMCVSNLKSIAMATSQYVRDYDEVYPPANRWSQALLRYSKNDTIFHCPSVEHFGYSMNMHLDALSVARVDDPAKTPVIFDSFILKKFQYDSGTSWAKDARHPLGNAVAFADGHVKLHRQKPLFRSFPPQKIKIRIRKRTFKNQSK